MHASSAGNSRRHPPCCLALGDIRPCPRRDAATVGERIGVALRERLGVTVPQRASIGVTERSRAAVADGGAFTVAERDRVTRSESDGRNRHFLPAEPGFVGVTGMTTGPHLHFAVHDAGGPMDPLSLLGN